MNKKIIWGVVIVIVVIIGVVLINQYSQKASPLVEDQTAATLDWKTFTSSKYGFTFQYPSTWNVQDALNNDEPVLFLQSPERKKYFEAHPDGPGGPLSEVAIMIRTTPTASTRENVSSIKSKDIVFNGIAAKNYIYNGDGPTFNSIVAMKNKLEYEIRTEDPVGEVESKIVSSFKFTN